MSSHVLISKAMFNLLCNALERDQREGSPVRGEMLEVLKTDALAVDLDSRGTEPVGWNEAYAAFVGAFDTPLARRRQSDEFSNDARRRLREINDRFK